MDVRGGDCGSRTWTSEVRLVLFEFHHEVVNVDELSPGREGSELGLGQDPVEAMVKLDQLGQGSLGGENQRDEYRATCMRLRPGNGVGNYWAGAADHLDDAGSVSEVGETPHYILAQRLH